MVPPRSLTERNSAEYMASPSTWQWSWKTTNDPSLRVSSSCRSSIFSFSFRRRSRSRSRTHVAKISIDNSFSVRNSKPELLRTLIEKGVKKKPVRIARSAEDTFLSPVDEDCYPKSKNPITSGEKVKNESSLRRKKYHKSLKSLFGKLSLWRRILFASRKFRSIILLNVITVVCGMFLPSLISISVSFYFKEILWLLFSW